MYAPSFGNPQILPFTKRDYKWFEDSQRALITAFKKRSQEAIDSASDFVLFRRYVCGMETYPYMMGWLEELNTGRDSKRLRGIAGDDTCILSPRGSAKAQPLDEIVLTPKGWRRMESLKVGDVVIAGDGTPTLITGTYEHGYKSSYRVTFTDGSSTECCDDHLWTVRNIAGGDPRKYQVLPLSHIRTKVFVKSTGTIKNGNVKTEYREAIEGEKPWLDCRGYAKYHIPIVNPVDFPKQDLPIHPYLLGVLLGDGCIGKGACVSFTTADDEIPQFIQKIIPDGYKVRKVGSTKYTYNITLGKHGKGRRNPIREALKDLCLAGCGSENKFIPNEYLYTSVEDRIELLQGLLDTDGSVASRDSGGGGTNFTTISPVLADDVIKLVQSLGGIATMQAPRRNWYTHNGEKRQGQTSYKLGIKLPEEIQPFKITRKLNRYKPCTKLKATRGIINIEYVGEKLMKCISVAHISQTYVTRNYIVTHNSTFLLQWIAWIIGTHATQGISLKILYISYVIDVASSKSRQIKAIIESERYQEVFPIVRPSKSKWGESEWAIDFAFAGLSTIEEPYTLACSGLQGAINSKRSDILLFDDLLKSPSEAKNKKIQDRMMENYNSIIRFTRHEGARGINLGTRMAKFDLYATTFVPANGWKVIKQSALLKDGNGEYSYCDDRVTLETLIEERRLDYESFLLQRQNEIPETTSIGIQPHLIKWGWMPVEFERIVIGIDTADSTEENSNATAIIVLGIANDCLYVIDGFEGRRQGNTKKIDLIYDFWAKRKNDCKYPAILAADYHRFSKSLEGDFEDYIEDIREDESLDNDFATVTIEKVKATQRGEKIDRIESHSGIFEKGRIFFNLAATSTSEIDETKVLNKVVDEITNYNALAHNDLMDALEVAIYTARQYITGDLSYR